MADNTDTTTLASQLKFYVDGPCVIYFGGQDCSASGYKNVSSAGGRLLGFTDGGATISYQTMTHRINGDEYGGAEGMPAEQLILGGQATIRATIVKWEQGNFERLMCGANDVAVSMDGSLPQIGKPYFSSHYGYAFWVIGLHDKFSYYFPKCELASQPRQWNISSLERRMSLSVQAYSVLNASTSEAITYYTDTESSISHNYTDCSAEFL